MLTVDKWMAGDGSPLVRSRNSLGGYGAKPQEARDTEITFKNITKVIDESIRIMK